MVHVYSTLIGGLLAGAATAVCSDKGRRQCMKDNSCGWQKRKCVAVEPESNPGMCETETAEIAKQKAEIAKQKAKNAKHKKKD